MNLLLLAQEDLLDADVAEVATDRYAAVIDWWPPLPGRRLRVGLCDGLMGSGIAESSSGGRVRIRFTLDQAPPPPLPLVLLMALPRPKMLRRVLRTAAELGIKEIHLINSSRVEKSYWQSPLLQPEALLHYLRAGLEQVCDTGVPRICLQPRLRPFVEDELPGIAAGSERLLAHPAARHAAPAARVGPVTLAIGPEAGFSEYETRLFESAGFAPFTLGPRILRSETALPVISATLFAATPDRPSTLQ